MKKNGLARQMTSIVLASTLVIAATPCASWAQGSLSETNGAVEVASLDPAAPQDDADYSVAGWCSHAPDRYYTAARAALFPNDGVIIVSGENFPDALAASGLAGLLGYGLLYTPSQGVGEVALTQISGNKIANVLIVGGSAVVSEEMERAVSDLPSVTSVTRISGSDRYATAEAVYRYGASVRGWDNSNAVVVSGEGFADAATASVYAAREAAPVFLAAGDGLLSKSSFDLASSFSHVLVAGGDAVVSDETVDRLSKKSSVDRFDGSDRYETSTKICAYLASSGDDSASGQGDFSYERIYFVTGSDFADALAYGTNVGMAVRWPNSGYNYGSESCPVFMLVDNGKISYALDLLKSVGTYCDDEKKIKRFNRIAFIGGSRLDFENTTLPLANGFGVSCEFLDGE